jgi:ATP-dependent helicase/nuclease subunit A
MTETQFAYALGGQPCTREAFYATACDPQRNVVVQACAGAGKTWMLVSRILRALLQAEHSADKPLAPQEILAITFTKKAAGEMRQRLQEWLQEFAHADEATLTNELLARGISNEIALQPNKIMHRQLSNLYSALLDSGRVVQIRTFHSWFGALLRSAPLAVLEQLGLPAHYELLEDDSEATALVWRRFYTVLDGDDALRSIYAQAVAAHGRFNIDKALGSALDKRVEFQLADAAGTVQRSIREFAQVYTEFEGLNAPLDIFAPGRPERQRLSDAAATLGRYDGAIPQKAASQIERALTDNQVAGALKALLTEAGTARKFSDKIPGVQAVRDLQTLCLRINAAQQQHTAWQHQQRMAQLTRILVACFSELKRERGWVDMGDVERAALHLLSDSVLSGWVLERLDAQTRHLLIDEFQDTNPLQWQALQAWLAGYAGAGGGTGVRSAPSVFIVGDPKQSIYRFRRAEPQVFIAATEFVCEALDGVVLSCDHTRRNARGVLAAVNAVMQGAAQEGYEGYRLHTTESQQVGQVLRLPLVNVEAEAAEDTSGEWRDTLTTPRHEAEEHIRTLECEQAAHWVAQHIASGVQPGEVMVLARKRDRLQRMASALQALGIASQISEKTQLMAHCAVQDVVALVDALVSPTHDLSLARALRSPLFACSDDFLVAMAQAARAQCCSWLDLFTTKLLSNDELLVHFFIGLEADLIHKTASQLRQYQQLFATLPPHDALAALYQYADVVARCMAAAPAPQRSAVAAQLQALLAASLDVDGGRFLTPYAWVRALKAGYVRTPVAAALAVADGDNHADGSDDLSHVKGANTSAVQLLTVHGAKGLEAHTVLMLDTNAQAEKPRSMDVLIDWPAQQAAPTTFAFLASESAPPLCVQDALQHEQAARAREETNALYVAMTRAQHTLALSAHAVRTPDPRSAWQRFEVLGDALSDAVAMNVVDMNSTLFDANPAFATKASVLIPSPSPLSLNPSPFTLSLSKGSQGLLRQAELERLGIHPDSVMSKSPNPENNHFYIQIMPVAQQDKARAATNNIAAEQPTAEDSTAARIGQCMHRLLEIYQPGADLAPSARSIGTQFQLDSAQSDQAFAIAQRITAGPAAWVWDSQHIDWQANEVELVHGNELLRLDRLVKHRATQTWWVLDYKSAAAPQRQAALRQQLTNYAQAVRAAHPEQSVRAAFITGEGALIEL